MVLDLRTNTVADKPRSKISMNNFYIYLHKKADTGEIFYIGKGKGIRAYRKGKKRSDWWNKIVAKHGYEVQIARSGLTEDKAFEVEKSLISLFKACGHVLCNMTDGGEGQSGLKPSEETRRKMSEANKGKKHSDDHKRKISEVMKGKKHSEEAKRKMSEVHKGKKRGKYLKKLKETYLLKLYP